MKIVSISKIIFILVLVLGSILRLYGLENQSLWFDEIYSWKSESYNTLSEVIKNAKGDVHPPGYHIFMYALEKLFGETEFVLRFPAAIFGIFSIVALFILGLQLYSSREALIASSFMAFFSFPIYYSQEARHYTILLFFSIIASSFLLSLLKKIINEKKLSVFHSSGYIGSAIILSYIDYYGVYLVGLQGVASILTLRDIKKLRIVILMYFLVFVFFLPWLPTMLKKYMYGVDPHLVRPQGFFICFYKWLEEVCGDTKAICLVLIFFINAMAIKRIYDAYSKKSWHRIKLSFLHADVLLAAWIIIPFTGAYIQSVLSTPVLQHRNLMISLPAIYLFVARSIVFVLKKPMYYSATSGLLAIASIYNIFFVQNYYSKPHKEQTREAVNFILEKSFQFEAAPIVVLHYNLRYFDCLDYYFKRNGSNLRSFRYQAFDENNIRNILTQNKFNYLWVVLPRFNFTPEELNRWSNFKEIIFYKIFWGMHVLLLKF